MHNIWCKTCLIQRRFWPRLEAWRFRAVLLSLKFFLGEIHGGFISIQYYACSTIQQMASESSLNSKMHFLWNSYRFLIVWLNSTTPDIIPSKNFDGKLMDVRGNDQTSHNLTFIVFTFLKGKYNKYSIFIYL